MTSTHKFTMLVVAALAPALAHAEPAAPQQAFFEELSTFCGKRYTGQPLLVPENDRELRNGNLVFIFDECTDDTVHIRFYVGGDRSRSLVVTREEAGLAIVHQRREIEGVAEAEAPYGGRTRFDGSARHQSFEADGGAAGSVPERWTLTLANNASAVTYLVERDRKPYFRAAFVLLDNNAATRKATLTPKEP